MSRKHIVPGDLVYHHKVMYEAGYQTRTGLVIGVDYPRNGEHMGCEERVKVFWMLEANFSLMCDCELLTLSELSCREGRSAAA